MQVDEEVAVQTKNLFIELSRIFETEKAWEEVVYPILRKLLGIKLKTCYQLACNEGESGTGKSTESNAVAHRPIDQGNNSSLWAEEQTRE